ncbi:Transthyretin-like family protein [Cooperia oncophora]
METLPLLGFLFIPTLAFREQHIGVHGQLMCGTAPLIGALVRLWSYKVVGPGHELANTTTDRNGHFYIQGKDSSLLPLNVRLKIKHHCETPTVRRWP